ncbi:MAG: hypothetical protein LBI77_00375 [Puniceicoccales bacterium]|nr:hypothetical protein [Puniceicoccales bacterium]
MLGLIFLGSYGAAKASEFSNGETLQKGGHIIQALEKLREDISKEEKEEAKKFLHSKGIIPEALYTKKDIDRAWSEDWLRVTQSVVPLHAMGMNRIEMDGTKVCLWGTTGTLVDVGIPGLEGRVVLCCAHAALPDFFDFRYKHYLRVFQGEESITEELFRDRYRCAIVSVNSQDFGHFQRLDLGWFDLGYSIPNFELVIEAECEPGRPMDFIPVSDIYVLTVDGGADCYDVALAILERPVEFEGEIVPGIDLNQLNVITDAIEIGDDMPFHMHLNEFWPDNGLSKNRCPVVIGYGRTGIPVEAAISLEGVNLSEEQERIFFGSGIKKAIVLEGLDLNGQGVCQNMKGCRCAGRLHGEMKMNLNLLERDLHRNAGNEYCNFAAKCFEKMKKAQSAESKKIYCDRAKRWLEFANESKESMKKDRNQSLQEVNEIKEHLKLMKPFYAEPRCGNGFSGSLILRKSANGGENYDVFGILSGPLFTDEIKDFIGNAAQYHLNNRENRY